MSKKFVGNVLERNVSSGPFESSRESKIGERCGLEPQNTTDISPGVGEGKGTEAGDGAEKIPDESICRWKGFLVCNRFTGEAIEQHQE